MTATPLDALLADGPLRIDQAVAYARQIADAIGALHDRGVVHGALEPAGIVVTSDGDVQIVDSAADRVATAAYKSPEQVEGRAIDPRSDIFSLGVVMYEMLTGRRPFSGQSDEEAIASILHDAPTPLRSLRSDVPALVAAIVHRCLSKDRGARYANGAALKKDLDAAARAVMRFGYV